MRTFLFATALLAAAPAAACAQDNETRQRIDTTFAFDKGGSVDLGQLSGEIIVTGWTKPEVRILATIETGYLESSLSSSRVRIAARPRRNRMGHSRFELSVPIGTQVRATTVSGNIAVRGTAGEVSVNSVSGDVEVRDATRTEIGTVSGEVRAEKLRGTVRARSVSGDITLDDVVGELRGKTVSGELLAHGTLAGLEFESVSGGFEFRGDLKGAGEYSINSHAGDIRLVLPANFAASLDVSTFSGDFRTEFPLTLQPGERSRIRNRRLQTTMNGGGPRISLETFSGDIIINKGAPRSNKED